MANNFHPRDEAGLATLMQSLVSLTVTVALTGLHRRRRGAAPMGVNLSATTRRPSMRPARPSLGGILAFRINIGVQGCRHLVRVTAHA
jgi:hypothetical protein